MHLKYSCDTKIDQKMESIETRQVNVSCTPLSGVRAGRDIASTASPVDV